MVVGKVWGNVFLGRKADVEGKFVMGKAEEGGRWGNWAV